MNDTGKPLRTLLELALLLALVFGLAAVIQSILGEEPASPPAQETLPYPPPDETPTDGNATDMPYPPPNVTEDAPQDWLLTPEGTRPTPLIITYIPGQAPTPWSSPTPPPQPTWAGPTEAPLPLIQPAQDASGAIVYIASNEPDEKANADALSFFSFALDAAGKPQGDPQQLGDEGGLQERWQTIFPSADCKRFAVMDSWGLVSIYDVEAYTLAPLARPQDSGGGAFMSWHPDNRRVLYRLDAGTNAGLVLIDAQRFTGLVREHSYTAISDAALSPDGQKLVYSFYRGRPERAELRLLALGAAAHEVIYTSASDIFMISWSPDGSLLAFEGEGEGLNVMHPDGTGLRSLPVGGIVGLYPFDPVWSPDSSTIAYVSSGPEVYFPDTGGVPVPFRATTIRLLDVASGEDRPLLADDVPGNIDPTWSPDGRQIAFVSLRSGSPEIWVVNADGSDLRQLTNAGMYVRYPCWRRP